MKTVSPEERANLFISALGRQVKRKRLFADGVMNLSNQDHLKLIASIAEELGEVSSEYVRQRYYNTIVECIDVAHSALLLAVSLDVDGEVLSRTNTDEN